MLFTNPGDAVVSREIKGVVYSCAPGDLVEIPDELSHFVTLEGVRLVPAESATAKAESAEAEQPVKAEQVPAPKRK